MLTHLIDLSSVGTTCSGISGTIRPESVAQLEPKWVAQLEAEYPQLRFHHCIFVFSQLKNTNGAAFFEFIRPLFCQNV